MDHLTSGVDELHSAWLKLKAAPPAELPAIAEGSGVPHETLRKLRRMDAPNSTYHTLRRLANHFAAAQAA